MGQPIEVSSRPGVRPDVMIYDINRSLTGMEILNYTGPPPAYRDRPSDELARRLFALGVTSVNVYSSAIVVTAPPEKWAELRQQGEDTIRELFVYYREGVTVPTDEEIIAQAEAAGA